MIKAAALAEERPRKALSDWEYTFSRSYDLTYHRRNMGNTCGQHNTKNTNTMIEEVWSS